MERFPHIPLESMSEEARAVAAAIASGPRGGVRGPFIPLMHNPPLAERLQALGEHLRFRTAFPLPTLELAILTVASHWRCGYEWYAHEKLARKAGLAPGIIEALAKGKTPADMSRQEATVHRFCTETLSGGTPSDTTYAEAQTEFGTAAVLDLLAVCGYYTLLAFVLNTAQISIPTDAGTPLDLPALQSLGDNAWR